MTDTNTPADKPPEKGAPAPPQIPPVVAKDAVTPAEPVVKPIPPAHPATISAPVTAKVEPVKPEPMKPAEPKAAETKSAAPAPPQPKPPFSPAPVPPQPKPPFPPASVPSQPKPQASSVASAVSLPPKPPADARVNPASSKSEGTSNVFWIATMAFIVLLTAGEGFQFYERSKMPDPAQFTALQSELKSAQQRVTALEQRPAPVAQDTSRIAALEAAVKALAGKAAPDTSALEQRLTTLESRPAPVMPDVTKDVRAAMEGASGELNAKIASLDSKVQQDLARTTRLRAATASLESGKPIGDMAESSPALQRYAAAAPPTEPALRQSFAGFAAAAEKASQPGGEGKGFGERMWARAQQLVTVRQGDKVLVGAPAAVMLAAARAKLDAGDLAGAVVALGPLDPAAAAAMAQWKREAQALLDARAALAAMATKS